MAHATHMAAMNAARKMFGKDWKATAYLEKADGEWHIQLHQKEVGDEEREANKDANDAFLAGLTPTIPALPAALTAPVIEEPASATPILPAFLQEAPQEEPAVPTDEQINDALLDQGDIDEAAHQAEADRIANAALITELVLTHDDKCPGCGIGLENGICDFDHLAEVQGVKKAYELQKHELSCMGCGYEWGPLVVLTPSGVRVPTGIKRPRISTTDKPTKKVWAIADSMPGKKRKEVIEACVAAGIAYGTARTQYQHWFKCVADQKVAPLAVIGANGAITIINQGDAGK